MPIAINGSGTVTGISVGGLPDGIVDTDMIAANAVTAPKRGAGTILQVKQVGKTDITSVTSSGNNDYSDIPSFSNSIEKQVVTDAHYKGYLDRQERDIESFKKDESVIIPEGINYEKLSGLSNEIKSKLLQVKPKTLGQAIRIDGVTPAAIIILLSHIKKLRYKATA